MKNIPALDNILDNLPTDGTPLAEPATVLNAYSHAIDSGLEHPVLTDYNTTNADVGEVIQSFRAHGIETFYLVMRSSALFSTLIDLEAAGVEYEGIEAVDIGETSYNPETRRYERLPQYAIRFYVPAFRN